MIWCSDNVATGTFGGNPTVVKTPFSEVTIVAKLVERTVPPEVGEPVVGEAVWLASLLLLVELLLILSCKTLI